MPPRGKEWARPPGGREARKAEEARQGTGTRPAPAKTVKGQKRGVLTAEGTASPRRSQLWAELRRLAPEKADEFNCAQVSTE